MEGVEIKAFVSNELWWLRLGQGGSVPAELSQRALSGDTAGLSLHRGLIAILCSSKLRDLPWHTGGGSPALALSSFPVKS